MGEVHRITRCLVIVVSLGMAAACGRKQAAATPLSPTGPPTGPTSACVPAGSTPGGPIADPNGPYAHRVAVGRFSSGARVIDTRHVLEHASVPDGVRTPDGRVLIYYVNGEDGGVWVASYTGPGAQPLSPISINGVPRPNGVVDPDAFVVDGRIRLAYLHGFGPPASGTGRWMCLAESTDGINFTVLGAALTVTEMWTDPSVIQLRNGQWLMAISAGTQTVLARSTDGLRFVAGERLAFGGVPEVALLDDGRVRLYVCAQGIQSYVSADGATAWSFEATVVPGPGLICDPSHVAGTDLFVYKTGY